MFQFIARASSADKADGDEGKMAIKREKDGLRIDFSGQKPATPLLDTVNHPLHMKNLSTQVNLTCLIDIKS